MRGTAGRLRRRGWTMGTAAVVIAAVFAGVLAGVTPVGAAGGSTVILSGRSIGPAALGMTVKAAGAALGPSVAQGPSRRIYSRYGIVVDFDSGVAVRIATAAAKYRTADGAGVGMAAAAAPRLVGDVNSMTTTSGRDTTVVYMFQGIGFVFRGGRAVEAFVVAPIALGQRPPSAAAVTTPAGPSIVVPGGPPLPPPPSGTVAPQPPAAPAAAPPAGTPAAALRDVRAGVQSVGGLTVTGTIVNTGTVPAGPLTVVATFTRASGDQVDGRQTVQGPIAPGASAPFLVQAATVADIIIRYQVAVMTAAGTLLAATNTASVPSSAYASFAQRQIHVKVDFGAPSTATGPPAVQILVSVADTGAIPAQWVQQITVAIPYTAGGTAGSRITQLRPGETQTVLVPAGATLGAPQVTGVVLSGQ